MTTRPVAHDVRSGAPAQTSPAPVAEWIRCTRCRHVHQEADRLGRRDHKDRQLMHSTCPRCDGRIWVMAPAPKPSAPSASSAVETPRLPKGACEDGGQGVVP